MEKHGPSLVFCIGYDDNGNMTSDLNKGIAAGGIEYNFMNMPTKITVSSGSNTGVLDYVYAADGVKLRKSNSNGTITDYVGNYVYEGGSLKQITHPEGYIEPDGQGGYDYVYRYVDIWGNTRVTYADDNNDGSVDASEIRREQNYYPFGMEHKGYNNISYGVKNNLKTYQGQEFTEDLGLNTHEWRYRVSDPTIGRFWQIDPLAEDYTYNSTYAFQENKLGMGIELEGLEKLDWNQLTDEGIARGTALGESYNPDNPNHKNMIYPGPPGKVQKVVKGVQGMTMGTVGAVASAAVIAESGGTASLVGGTTAFTLSVTEIGIGFGQILDAIANGGTNEPLHKSSSLPGLVAYQNESEYAEFIDAGGQLLPGLLTGGNLKTIVEEGGAVLSGNGTFMNALNTFDAVQDVYGAIEAGANTVISSQSSSNNTGDNPSSSSSSGLDSRLVKPEENPFN